MMEDKVSSFNKLPRPKKTPSGLPNHWVFGVCHVDLYPPGDLVLAVHPKSYYLKQGGPAQIYSLATRAEKAEALIPYLLDAFMMIHPDTPPPVAPWTWSTLEPDLAQAVQDGLRNHGVTPELCKVGVCSSEERDILEEARAGFFEKVMSTQPRNPPATVDLGDSTRCHGCGMSHECFFLPLKKCARCSRVYYHSRDCQKQHWKRHKPTCSPVANAPGPGLDAYAYYNTKASTDPDARALIKSLHIESHPARGGLALPLRRLVLAGQDTPKNMQLLYGPQWESSMKKDHEEARIQCLLDPPPGSPSHVLNAWMDDASIVRSLRPATEAEQQRVKEIREMQELIRRRVGAGKSPTSGDMHAILTAAGSDWVSRIPTYTLAANTMDQGVPAGGYGG
ncbi:hypothetical protein B0T25DRAFT_138465 [Lasiosphaeria hispida]|uniref:MYND-type domain-containing protein n=1 Tax=Lasiosphaeria hispida TaxID=260671 RepID=A0AAJ0MFH7_9PEZI|nr:hypothetical protein B0T25DRAFT_138465 [Lasiosphaeria hispida]